MSKLIIFDFEGTLVDFQWKLAECMKVMREILNGYRINYNIPCDDKKYLKMNYSLLYNYFSKNIKDPYLRKKIMNDFDRIYDYYDEDASLRWQLLPSVKEVLNEFKNRGYKLAIDSNVGRKALNKMIRKFDILKYFDITISRNEVKMLKPNPEGVYRILDYFNEEDFKEKFFVGDSVTDIKTAKKANKNFIMISIINGEDKIENLLKHNPHHLIHSFSELVELI